MPVSSKYILQGGWRDFGNEFVDPNLVSYNPHASMVLIQMIVKTVLPQDRVAEAR